ncbi:MAG: nitrophenyl compound nitroreductase subunit ArsF family protein [Methanoregula sp.]|nr:nitrophenyl compound nitroreductase subunit ArsF family protein [Methanoregula sp.]
MAIIHLKHYLIIGCCITIFLLTAGCTGTSRDPGTAAPLAQPVIASDNPGVRVEVYHFHGDQQCSTCIAVGDLAEKTVKANFNDELASGRLVFAHVNYNLPENAALAEKYGVTGSALWIGTYDANGFHKQQDLDVWYLTDNEDAYTSYLSGIITRRLNGDLT